MKKITQNHEECIGCGACTIVCPEHWEMKDDNKAYPKKGKKNPQTGEYEFEVEETGCNQDAADSCPVQVIKIT